MKKAINWLILQAMNIVFVCSLPYVLLNDLLMHMYKITQ